MEDGETRSQSHPVEYDWLGPDLTRNTRGRYILIFTTVLISPIHVVCTGLESVSHYPPFTRRLLSSGYLLHIQCQRATQSAKNPPFPGFLRKLVRIITKQSTDKVRERNGRTVFLCVLSGGGVNFVFILYFLILLVPHYSRQLYSSTFSIRQENDAVDDITILCLFHWVGHCLRHQH